MIAYPLTNTNPKVKEKIQKILTILITKTELIFPERPFSVNIGSVAVGRSTLSSISEASIYDDIKLGKFSIFEIDRKLGLDGVLDVYSMKLNEITKSFQLQIDQLPLMYHQLNEVAKEVGTMTESLLMLERTYSEGSSSIRDLFNTAKLNLEILSSSPSFSHLNPRMSSEMSEFSSSPKELSEISADSTIIDLSTVGDASPLSSCYDEDELVCDLDSDLKQLLQSQFNIADSANSKFRSLDEFIEYIDTTKKKLTNQSKKKKSPLVYSTTLHDLNSNDGKP